MNKLLLKAALCSLALGATYSASAFNVSYDSFGSTSDTFGGSGIPNNAVATTTIANNGASISLGLTAHQRYDNPALLNDGAGTFTATAGSNAKPTAAGAVGAHWNFAWDIDIDNGQASDYNFKLLYDFDPAANTAEADHGTIFLSNPLASLDDSQNLLFSFLDGSTPNGILAGILGLTDAPNGSFDPNANGEYTFALIASDFAGQELGRSAIRVNVVGGTSSSVPDGGATSIFLGLGFAGLCAFRKLRK